MPPAVEPAQPPMKLVKMSSVGSAPGQVEKFSVVKPVLVYTDTAWKSAERSECIAS